MRRVDAPLVPGAAAPILITFLADDDALLDEEWFNSSFYLIRSFVVSRICFDY